MKIIILAPAAMLLAISTQACLPLPEPSGNGRQAQQKIFTIGAEGGISIASLSFEDKNINDAYESRTGYAAGVALQYNFKKVFSLRTGAVFERKGTKTELTFTDTSANIIGTGELKINLGYLSIPLLLRATFGNKINFFVQGGPYWAALLTARQELETEAPNITVEPDIKYAYESSEFGVSGGIGAAALFNEMILLSVEVRNNLGITDIRHASYEVKTRSLLFLAGVALTFGSRKE